MFTLSNKNILLYGISALFIAVNSFLITKEIYYFALFPFAVLLAYLYVVSLEKVFLLITFLTPLSIPIQDFIPSMPFNMAIPTEPMVFILMLVFLFKLIHENNYPKSLFGIHLALP